MDQSARRNKARSLAIAAAETWIDQWEGYEGMVVTGFVLIVESQEVGGVTHMSWMTGNGEQPNGVAPAENITHGGAAGKELGPLPAWRVRGLCGQVVSELDGREAYLQAKRLRDREEGE